MMQGLADTQERNDLCSQTIIQLVVQTNFEILFFIGLEISFYFDANVIYKGLVRLILVLFDYRTGKKQRSQHQCQAKAGHSNFFIDTKRHAGKISGPTYSNLEPEKFLPAFDNRIE